MINEVVGLLLGGMNEKKMDRLQINLAKKESGTAKNVFFCFFRAENESLQLFLSDIHVILI